MDTDETGNTVQTGARKDKLGSEERCIIHR